MVSEITYREFEEADTRPVFKVFRTSVFDYVRQIGLVGADAEDDIEAAWNRQGSMARHLADTAHADWVAEQGDKIIGWARSIERDGHVQLTHFFVDPSAQGKGVGRGLLKRAFSEAEGQHRAVIATQNPLALGLYLRSGVEFRGQTFELAGTPRVRDVIGTVLLERSDLTEEIISIDIETVGFERRVDLEYLADDRPLYAVINAGRMVGYAFGSNGTYTGPAAVVTPDLLPGVLSGLDTEAAAMGIDYVRYTIPGPAAGAIRWALNAGHRIDPFYEVLLTEQPHLKLDRYLMTQPGFIW
ncbi:MAG: GNAT family N-acetyltransferase [Acidimicrobiia bacterium]